MNSDLEFLREMFKDTRLHVGIGAITKLSLASDNSTLYVVVNLLPENREVIAQMGWADVNIVSFPEPQDLVLVLFVDGHPDEAFVVKLISTAEEPIPLFARTGHLVLQSRPGKKSYLHSEVKVGISKPGSEPTEPLVLGNVLISGLTALCNAFLNASQIGVTPMGPCWLDPSVRTAINNFVTTYLTTTGTNVASQIGFTERGN